MKDSTKNELYYRYKELNASLYSTRVMLSKIQSNNSVIDNQIIEFNTRLENLYLLIYNEMIDLNHELDIENFEIKRNIFSKLPL